jgi:hypothetical protein
MQAFYRIQASGYRLQASGSREGPGNVYEYVHGDVNEYRNVYVIPGTRHWEPGT